MKTAEPLRAQNAAAQVDLDGLTARIAAVGATKSRRLAIPRNAVSTNRQEDLHRRRRRLASPPIAKPSRAAFAR
jgi:hypothetical protein